MSFKILKSRILWIVTAVVFVVLIVFFDRNNYIDRAAMKRDIDTLRVQRDYYLQHIAEDSMEIVKLQDDAYLERYAREHFLMRRDSEVVYVMENFGKL